MWAFLTVLNLCGDGRRYAVFPFPPLSRPLFNPLLSPPPRHSIRLNLITRGLIKKNRKRKRRGNRKMHRLCHRNSQLPLKTALLPPKSLVLPLLLLPPLRPASTSRPAEDLHRGLKKSRRTKSFFSFEINNKKLLYFKILLFTCPFFVISCSSNDT